MAIMVLKLKTFKEGIDASEAGLLAFDVNITQYRNVMRDVADNLLYYGSRIALASAEDIENVVKSCEKIKASIREYTDALGFKQPAHPVNVISRRAIDEINAGVLACKDGNISVAASSLAKAASTVEELLRKDFTMWPTF